LKTAPAAFRPAPYHQIEIIVGKPTSEWLIRNLAAWVFSEHRMGRQMILDLDRDDTATDYKLSALATG
jgi:hypothetical protein